ncbi:MAG: DNA-deoxyinosine glycosylase [Burkholderiaceae bacterium]|jgi:hypoxanthine-DNA glycosylase
MLKKPEIPANPPPPGERLTGLPPVVSDHTALLILGSFPGAASLAAQQYYGHPQNHFWRILQAIWPSSQRQIVLDSYENRIAWLLDHRLGLWDVYASCERQGSLDTAIRYPQINDFAALKARCPSLVAIAHNGGESYKHARHTAMLGVEVHRLPSSSPANASWSFERKLSAWRDVFEQHRLI